MTATRKPAGLSLADFQTLDQPLKPAEQKPWKQLAKVLLVAVVFSLTKRREE